MAKGRPLILEGSNCYHSLKVQEVRTYEDKRYLQCRGGRFRRDLKNPSGWRVIDYDLTVRVEGFLTEYVDYEISSGDNIFVVGYPADSIYKTSDKVLRYPIVVAECIFKADYLKYFPMKNIGEQ